MSQLLKPKNNLPHRVLVLGQPFTVHYVDSKDDCVGETHGDLHRIEIDKHLNTARLWRVLLHEYIHATLHVNGLGNVLNGDVEEVIAQSLEYSLTQFIHKHGHAFIDAVSGDSHE